MSIVWPCTISVEQYLAAGRDIEVARPDCPGCAKPLWFWSGYHRFIRIFADSVNYGSPESGAAGVTDPTA